MSLDFILSMQVSWFLSCNNEFFYSGSDYATLVSSIGVIHNKS
jgi:hypothetical protein